MSLRVSRDGDDIVLRFPIGGEATALAGLLDAGAEAIREGRVVPNSRHQVGAYREALTISALIREHNS